MKKEIKVTPIKNGTVIDHLPPFSALTVLKILGIKETKKRELGKLLVTVAMNVNSTKCDGHKDFIKIENRELKPREVDRIAVVAPTATINIIREEEVVDKWQVELPNFIEGIIICPNPGCISNDPKEPIISKFKVKKIRGHQPEFRCYYCEKKINDVGKNLKY